MRQIKIGQVQATQMALAFSPFITMPSPAAAAIPAVTFGFLVGAGLVIAGIARRKLKESA